MPIERLTRPRLSPEERAAIESALQDHERHRYEDRQIFVMLLVAAAAWLMVAEVFLLHEVRKWYGREDDPLQSFEGFSSALPESLLLLWDPRLLEFAALVTLPLVMGALIVHAWRTRKGWNGYALASFGLVRVRGNALRVLRYKDISAVCIAKGSEIFHGRNSTLLEVFDETGRSLIVVGYSLESWKDRIEASRPAPRSLEDPGRKSDRTQQPAAASVTEQFARLHGFTMEELQTNRAGQIHPSQAARTDRGSGCAVALGIYAAATLVVAIVGGLIMYGPFPSSGADRGGLIGWVGGGAIHAAIFGGVAMLIWKRVAARRRVYESARLGVLEGALEKVHIRRGAKRGGDEYRYRIGERSFCVPRAAWGIAADGARYRIYFVAGDLLSIEPANPSTP